MSIFVFLGSAPALFIRESTPAWIRTSTPVQSASGSSLLRNSRSSKSPSSSRLPSHTPTRSPSHTPSTSPSQTCENRSLSSSPILSGPWSTNRPISRSSSNTSFDFNGSTSQPEPSTSSGVTRAPRPRFSRQLFENSDDDDEDSSTVFRSMIESDEAETETDEAAEADEAAETEEAAEPEEAAATEEAAETDNGGADERREFSDDDDEQIDYSVNPRKSPRPNKGQTPARFKDYVLY